MYQFFKFVNEVKSDCQYYNQLDVNKYNENFYDEYPCSSKKDLLDNYRYCVNSKFINPCDNTIFENIMAVNDLSRNHDKKLKIGNEDIHIETTSGTTGKPLPILKTDRIRLIEGRYLMKCRKHIERNMNFNNVFFVIHNSDKNVTDLDIRNDKDKFKDYDKNEQATMDIKEGVRQCNYAASKAGMIALTKSLAKESGDSNVLVNVVCPGFIQTDLNKNCVYKRTIAQRRSAIKNDYALNDLINFTVLYASDFGK